MSKTPRSIAADHACKPLICGIEFNADNLLSKRHYWRLSFSVLFHRRYAVVAAPATHHAIGDITPVSNAKEHFKCRTVQPKIRSLLPYGVAPQFPWRVV
jgi:hypothetical protein